MTLNAITHTLLEQTAIDNGFDLPLPSQADWIGFQSTQVSLQIWLTVTADIPPAYLIAWSLPQVARALISEFGIPAPIPPESLPKGARAAHKAAHLNDLNLLIRRAFQLAQVLPNPHLEAFQTKTQKLPQTTEAERWTVQRIGQDLFRGALMDHWQFRCALTGLDVPELLRASHIKPWADCASDEERLDVCNGFLFAPHIDALFDRGYLTVEDDGRVILWDGLSQTARERLGLGGELRIEGITSGHQKYLPWHRERVFKGSIAT